MASQKENPKAADAIMVTTIFFPSNSYWHTVANPYKRSYLKQYNTDLCSEFYEPNKCKCLEFSMSHN